MKRKALAGLLVAAIVAAFGVAPATAQSTYPDRPIRVLIGFSAGGPTDTVGRILAELLGKELKQTVVVENRPGGNGAVAAHATMGSAADGYTLMLGSSGTLSIAPVFKEKLSYDVLKNFTPVALVASYPYLLVVPGSSPVNSTRELIDMAKQKPGQITFASAGAGSVNHLAAEWLKSATAVNVTHVPYKGDSAAIADLVAGRVDFAFLSAVAASPHVKTGKMKALAIASAAPSPFAQGVPTVASFGIPDFVAEPWNGILGPAGMAPDIVKKLNGAINQVMNRPETKERLAAVGQHAMTDSPEGFRRHIETQTARWAEVIKKGNIPKEP